MKKLVLALTVLALPTLLMTSTSVNAVIDCNKDSLFIRTICNDEEFSKLYYEVNKELKNIHDEIDKDMKNHSYDLLNEMSPVMLKHGDKSMACKDKECLKEEYEQYLEQLKLIGFNAKSNKIAKEKDDEINFKNLQLGMNKDAIPSKIKLVNGEKMYDFDKSFRFKVTDGNNNKIDIYGMSFDVSVIIRGDNNTVENITYTAKEAKNISETTLVELSKFFTSKSLKKRNLRYENGQLSNIVLEHTEINNGIKDDFRVIYNNENSTGSKNEVIVELTLESADADEKRMKEATDEAFGSS